MSKVFFGGVTTALVTPFKGDYIDLEALERLVDNQISAKVNGLVIAGTTGEGASLGDEEYSFVLRNVVSLVKGKIKVIAGSGVVNTADSIRRSKMARDEGVDGLLVVTPYYNRPPQNGLYQHFTSIADQVNLPILLYNVPRRTGIDLENDTILALSDRDNIVGIKEASGDMNKLKDLLNRIKVADDNFVIVGGNDDQMLDFYGLGGRGIVSVWSNIMPKLVVRVNDLLLAGNHDQAKLMYDKFFKFIELLFVQSNPIPTKYVLYSLGIIENTLRLPLIPLEGAFESKLRSAMAELGLSSSSYHTF